MPGGFLPAFNARMDDREIGCQDVRTGIRYGFPEVGKENEMAMNEHSPEFAISDLPVDVFELSTAGLEVESLTAGHGMVEHGGSNACNSMVLACSCGQCACSSGSCHEVW